MTIAQVQLSKNVAYTMDKRHARPSLLHSSVVTQRSYPGGEERCMTTPKTAVKQTMQDPNTFTISVPKVININFLITISLHNKENRLGELIQ